MRRFQIASIKDPDDELRDEGLVLEEYAIIHMLDFLSEAEKDRLLSWFLLTRHDRYMVYFVDGSFSFYDPDDVEVTWFEGVA